MSPAQRRQTKNVDMCWTDLENSFNIILLTVLFLTNVILQKGKSYVTLSSNLKDDVVVIVYTRGYMHFEA